MSTQNRPLPGEGPISMHALPPTMPKGERMARLITNIFYPHWVAMVLLALVTFRGASGVLDFAVWWVESVVFLAILPYASIVYALRRGRISDRNVTRATERAFPFAFAIVSFGTGTLLMLLFNAPREVLGVGVGSVVGMAIAFALAPRFKISIHAAGVAGTIAILTIAFGVWALLLTPLAPMVAWARVQIAHHTIHQVVAGAIIGAAVASSVYWAVVATG